MAGFTRRDALKALAAATSGIVVLSDGSTSVAAGTTEALTVSGSKLTGTVVLPDSVEYDSARTLWDGLFVSHPKVIVFCKRPKDAVNAIAWATVTKPKVPPKSFRRPPWMPSKPDNSRSSATSSEPAPTVGLPSYRVHSSTTKPYSECR